MLVNMVVRQHGDRVSATPMSKLSAMCKWQYMTNITVMIGLQHQGDHAAMLGMKIFDDSVIMFKVQRLASFPAMFIVTELATRTKLQHMTNQTDMFSFPSAIAV